MSSPPRAHLIGELGFPVIADRGQGGLTRRRIIRRSLRLRTAASTGRDLPLGRDRRMRLIPAPGQRFRTVLYSFGQVVEGLFV